MKTFATLITLLAFSTALAQEVTLKETMKSLGQNFGAFAQSIQAGQLQESDLELVENIQSFASQASLIYPETANTTELKLRYSELMAQLINKTLLLEKNVEEALVTDGTETSQARQTFIEINQIRQAGHQEFKLD